MWSEHSVLGEARAENDGISVCGRGSESPTGTPQYEVRVCCRIPHAANALSLSRDAVHVVVSLLEATVVLQF